MWYLACGISDHLTYGATVGYIAKWDRADQIRVGGQEGDRAGLQDAAGVSQLLVGKFAVVGNQHKGNILGVRIRGTRIPCPSSSRISDRVPSV